MKKLEQTNDIMQRLFDPKVKSFNAYVDTTFKKQIHKSLPQNIKQLYGKFCLEEHWEEICGAPLAQQCMVESLVNGTLTIRTSSSLLANELFMMQKLFLQKVNKYLEKSLAARELKFHTGSIKHKVKPAATPSAPTWEIIRCPHCGAKMTSEKKICSVCEREQRSEVQQKLLAELKNQPWLSYDECQKHFLCERTAFNDAKEILQNYYFEKVRLNHANDEECCMAVMLLTGKSIEQLDAKLMENSLTFLRRNQDVSTSRV